LKRRISDSSLMKKAATKLRGSLLFILLIPLFLSSRADIGYYYQAASGQEDARRFLSRQVVISNYFTGRPSESPPYRRWSGKFDDC